MDASGWPAILKRTVFVESSMFSYSNDYFSARIIINIYIQKTFSQSMIRIIEYYNTYTFKW